MPQLLVAEGLGTDDQHLIAAALGVAMQQERVPGLQVLAVIAIAREHTLALDQLTESPSVMIDGEQARPGIEPALRGFAVLHIEDQTLGVDP